MPTVGSGLASAVSVASMSPESEAVPLSHGQIRNISGSPCLIVRDNSGRGTWRNIPLDTFEIGSLTNDELLRYQVVRTLEFAPRIGR